MRASIVQLLSEDVIVFPPPGQAKEDALEGLVRLVGRKAELSNLEKLSSEVRAREKSLSTTLDSGLSLPHARVDGLANFAAGLNVFKAPLNGSAVPIRAMFLFFSPNRPEFFPRHLELLRGVSSLFRPALLEQLAAAQSPAAARALIQAAGG